MINIEIPYSELKGKRLDFEFNGILLMAWLWIIDDNDEIVKMWEFIFEEV
jgi:hypothetical protein